MNGRKWSDWAPVPLWLGAMVLVAMAAAGPLLAAGLVGLVGLTIVLVLAMGFEKAAVVFLVPAMIFAPMNAVRPSSAVEVVTVSDAFFVLGFGLLIPVLANRRWGVPPLLMFAYVIFLVLAFGSTVFANDSLLSANYLARLIVGAIVLPIGFMAWNPQRKYVTILAGSYVGGVVVSSIGALIIGADATARYQGLTGHPNFFGLTAMLAVCLVPYLSASVPRSLRVLLWLSGAFCFYAIVISGSRAALLATIAVAVIYPVLARSAVVVGSVVLAVIAGLAMSRQLFESTGENAINRLFAGSGSSADASDLERSRALTEGLKEFGASPFFGNGFENAIAAHNVYLQIAVSVGVLGLLTYLYILANAVKPVLDLGNPLRMLALPAMAYVLLAAISNILWDRMLWSVLALSFVALAHGRHREDLPSASTDSVPGKWRRVLA